MRRFSALGFVALLLLSACSKPEHGTGIRFAIAQSPLNLDPRYATDAASERVNRLLYRPLVDFDEHARPRPALAEWQRLSATQYRFILTGTVPVFHHGRPFSMRDVEATYASLLALKDTPHSAEFANIDRMMLIDGKTLDFHLKLPDEFFPSRMIIGILPADLIQQEHDFSHQPVGNGPLRFVSWNGMLRLERIRDRQRFSLVEVRDPTVRVLKLKRGEVDMLQGDLPPELVAYLKSQPEIRVESSMGSNFSYLGFNLQGAQLENPLIRRAVAHSIDRKSIIEKAMVEKSREAGAILPPEHWAGSGDLKPYEYNPGLSRELLERAGVKLPLRLVYKTSTDAQRVRLATILQAQMRPAGIELEIRSLDWGTFFDDIKQGHFQLYGLTWVGIKTPEIYRHAFHSGSVPPKGANRGRLHDAELDKRIEQGDWQQVTGYIHQLLPYVPLWYEGQFAAMRKGLADYALKPDGNWDGLATIRYAH